MNAEVYESYKKPDHVCIYVYKLLTTYAADALFVNQLKKDASHLVNLPRCFYINKTPPALGKRLAYIHLLFKRTDKHTHRTTAIRSRQRARR
jgi:hypothetical protein